MAPRPSTADEFILEHSEGWKLFPADSMSDKDRVLFDALLRGRRRKSIEPSDELAVDTLTSEKEYLLAYVDRTRVVAISVDSDFLISFEHAEMALTHYYCIRCRTPDPEYLLMDEESVGIIEGDDIKDRVLFCKECMNGLVKSVQDSKHSVDINRHVVAGNL